MLESVAILAFSLFLYAAFAGRLEKTLVGGAISYTAIGLVLGAAGLVEISPARSWLSVLAEVTLALLLFSDAATANLREVFRERVLPQRLLLLGLPGAVLGGIVVGYVLLRHEAGFLEIALIAAMLAPTDAALGKAVVTDVRVPERIRSSLNFESGLNDGLSVPIFLAILALLAGSAAGESFGEIALRLLVAEIGIGALAGLGVTGASLAVIAFSRRLGALDDHWGELMTPSIAATCYCLAQYLGGSGFIAAFVGGLLFGAGLKSKVEEWSRPAEILGDGAAMLTWVVFGATVLAAAVSGFTWQALAYAVLSLTLVRMLPVWLCLRGTGTPLHEALFIGWFGPRGLASVVFAIMVVESGVPGADVVATVVALTVTLSIIAHGLSAKPLASRFAQRPEQTPRVDPLQGTP